MNDLSARPVVRGAAYFLAHVPGLVRHGSKPSREIPKEPGLMEHILGHLRSFPEAVAYSPHQVFIGNLSPTELAPLPRPWYEHPLPEAVRWGPFGEVMPEEEFLGVLKVADDFELVWLEEGFARQVRQTLSRHPLVGASDLKKVGGVPMSRIEGLLAQGVALPLHVAGNRLVGCVQRGHEEDLSLVPEVILENLVARASAAMALRRLLQATEGVAPMDIDYLLGCGEEAVGDRYNRGGGNLSKAIGELCACQEATGSDVKAFCCAPVHALVLGASLVATGLYRHVVVVGGGSLAKLGMKFRGHLAHDMPILEDVLAAIAILLGRDDGRSPSLRLDVVGHHTIGSGSAQQAIIEKLVREPLGRVGLRITDVDKYATEMQDPEITEPAGSGNVPRTNYRILGGLAVLSQEWEAGDLDRFVERYGMPGFAPTQGHIASAVPFLGHALRAMHRGEMQRSMFLAKGSLFLGRMTQLSDGISFLLERNHASKDVAHQ